MASRDSRRSFARLWFYASVKEWMPVVALGLVVLVAAGAILAFQTSGIFGIGAGERSPEERRELLSEGSCMVRDGQPLGRIVGEFTPTRGNPSRRFQVALIDERRVLQMRRAEVEVVDCSTIVQGR